jgi:hypothetical protein
MCPLAYFAIFVGDYVLVDGWGGDNTPPPNQILVAFDAHGDTHTATDAKCRQALLGVLFLHFVQ